MLGLPENIRACLFDLDGVLTQTAKVHASAWKEMFDQFLHHWSDTHGVPFVAFDVVEDYDTYVDGKPRGDGTRDFLASRKIHLPEGKENDGLDANTVTGLGNAKNDIVLRMIRQDGVDAYAGSVRYLHQAAAAGLRRVVVSSSTNCHDVLVAAGLIDLVEDRIDGAVAQAQHLRGKPAPDTYLAGAKLAGVDPSEAAVFEDALAGVEAGRAGKFGFVVGLDRVGQAAALKAHGADIVVADLDELLGTQ